SLGEIASLAAAGSIPWETALLLVKERGRIMAQASHEQAGGMIAIVGLDEAAVESIREEASAHGKLWVANRTADVQFVLSGEVAAVQEAERLPPRRRARRGGGAARPGRRGAGAAHPAHPAGGSHAADGRCGGGVSQGGRQAADQGTV